MRLLPYILCLGISFILAIDLSSWSVDAQSDKCYSCIQGAIPKTTNCEALSAAQYEVIEKIIHGAKVYNSIGVLKAEEPISYNCLVSLMWDVVHYKANLWSTCLKPDTACSWPEMMHYLEMIPKVASVYGFESPP
ncbi:hypothetical protein BGZ76_009928, partial [Entomortierella beljakovae]